MNSRIFLIAGYIFLFLLGVNLNAIAIDDKSTSLDILSHSQIYLDSTNSLDLEEIKKKNFVKNDKSSLAYGFSWDKALWIKITLKNISKRTLYKTIEYQQPLAENIYFYDNNSLIKTSGMWNISVDRNSIHPKFDIVLEPYEQKVYYFKVYSKISTLIVKLVLWDEKDFLSHDYNHKIVLFMFFGILGTLLVYNFMLFVFTKDIAYFYYIAYLFGVMFFQAHYTGFSQLYIYPSWFIPFITKASMVYIGYLLFMMVMFTRVFLSTSLFPMDICYRLFGIGKFKNSRYL